MRVQCEGRARGPACSFQSPRACLTSQTPQSEGLRAQRRPVGDTEAGLLPVVISSAVPFFLSTPRVPFLVSHEFGAAWD